jgi:hypothetical protein
MRFAHAVTLAVASFAAWAPFVSAGAQPAASAAPAEACPIPKVVVPRPSDAQQWPAWVASRVGELQPTQQERKIDRIGWSRTILDAEKLAKEHGRPVFLFTHDGRINTGRC